MSAITPFSTESLYAAPAAYLFLGDWLFMLSAVTDNECVRQMVFREMNEHLECPHCSAVMKNACYLEAPPMHKYL